MKNMKKVLPLLAVVCSLFILVGCGGSKEETKTFETKQNGAEMSLTYTYKGDIVSKQTATNKIPYSSLGVSTKEEAQAVTKAIEEQYQGVKGLKETMDFKEDHAIEKVEVDYEKADLEELSAIPGMNFSDTSKDGISMKKTQEMLEKMNFKEKK